MNREYFHIHSFVKNIILLVFLIIISIFFLNSKQWTGSAASLDPCLWLPGRHNRIGRCGCLLSPDQPMGGWYVERYRLYHSGCITQHDERWPKELLHPPINAIWLRFLDRQLHWTTVGPCHRPQPTNRCHRIHGHQRRFHCTQLFGTVGASR